MGLKLFKYIFDMSESKMVKKISKVVQIDHSIKVLTPPQAFLHSYEEILADIPDDDYILCPLSIHDGDLAGISLGIKGKMKLCENFLDTASRELGEEVGLNVVSYRKPIMNINKRDKIVQCAVFYTAEVNNVYNLPIQDIKTNTHNDIKNQKVCVLIHGSEEQFLTMMTQTPRYLINDGENIIGFALVPKLDFLRFIKKFKELFEKYLMSNFYCIFYDKQTDAIYERAEDILNTSKFRPCIYSLGDNGNAVINTELRKLRYWNTTRTRYNRYNTNQNTFPQDYNQNQLQSI